LVGHRAEQSVEDADEGPPAGIGAGDRRLGQHGFADRVWFSDVGEPNVAVRPRGNPNRDMAARREQWELGDDACGGDLPDPFAIALGKPKIAVRSDRNAFREAEHLQRELGHETGGRDAADAVVALYGEPKVAVRTSHDVIWTAAGAAGAEFGDNSA